MSETPCWKSRGGPTWSRSNSRARISTDPLDLGVAVPRNNACVAFSWAARLQVGVASMPIAQDVASGGVRMAAGITLIAVFLGLRQWYESRAREPDLSDLDRTYFIRQDLRRGLGV